MQLFSSVHRFPTTPPPPPPAVATRNNNSSSTGAAATTTTMSPETKTKMKTWKKTFKIKVPALSRNEIQNGIVERITKIFFSQARRLVARSAAAAARVPLVLQAAAAAAEERAAAAAAARGTTAAPPTWPTSGTQPISGRGGGCSQSTMPSRG